MKATRLKKLPRLIVFQLMSFRRLRQLIAFSLFAGAVFAGDGVMAGRIDGDYYVSPTGEFKVPSPVLPELGGTIADTDNVVTFSDSFNTHLSIACFELDAAQKWELETRSLRDYLLYFFNNFVLADFKARFPKSSIESARFIPQLMGGTMITFALLPGGSYFENKSRVGPDPVEDPVVAKRSTLLFVRNRYIYVVSTELAERATQRSTYKQTTEEENQVLSDRLTSFVGRFVFFDARNKTP